MKFRIISTFFLFSALSWAADDDADEVLSVCKTAVAPKEATGAVSLFVKRDELGFPLGLTQQKEAVSEASKTAGDAQTSLTRSAGKLHSIGGRAKDAHSTARTASEKLDREYAEIVALSSSSGELVLSQSVLAPFFHDHLYAIGLATDNADFFDHQRWVKNLSSQNANYPAYHNLETHSASTLADNVYVSSRHCSSHREQSGHYYCGASSCCQFYTRGVRQELIALAAFSARHSRAHDTYVQEFNKFEQKINLFHHQYRALAGTHGGVFTLTTYPVKPADSYIKTSFKDWLLQLASNNNNPNILSLTDLDDPGMMAEKVYVSCRHGGCGHGAGQQYTSWDYCGNHHVRAIKVEMFEVALALIRNQRHHNIYVQQALQFEIAAKAMVASYWSALQAWSSFPISGGAIRGISPLYSYWERLKSNRDQLRTHLSTSLTVLESASECEAIAGDISSVSGSLRVVGDAASGFDVTSLAVHVEIDKLQQALREAESSKSILTLRVGTLEEEKKKLDERVRTEDWGARERELVSTFETRLKANQQEEKEKEKQKVARLLGSMLYTLNAKKDRSDLEQFKQYTSFDEMVDMASTLILESLKEKMSSK